MGTHTNLEKKRHDGGGAEAAGRSRSARDLECVASEVTAAYARIIDCDRSALSDWNHPQRSSSFSV